MAVHGGRNYYQDGPNSYPDGPDSYPDGPHSYGHSPGQKDKNLCWHDCEMTKDLHLHLRCGHW